CVFLAVEEGQEGEATAAGDWRHLVKRTTGKHQRAANRWSVKLPSEFRKHQVATAEVIVEIDRDREAAVLRANVEVVAVAMKVSADLAVIAGDDVAIHACRRKLEVPLDLRNEPAGNVLTHELAHLRHDHAHVAAALESPVQQRGGLAIDVELKARLLAALVLVELHQKIAQLEAEYPRHYQRLRNHRNACGF